MNARYLMAFFLTLMRQSEAISIKPHLDLGNFGLTVSIGMKFEAI